LWCARFAESEVELERLHAAQARAEDELGSAREAVIAAERVLEGAEKGKSYHELQTLLGERPAGPSVAEAQAALSEAEADRNRARQFCELAANHIVQAEQRRAIAQGARDDAIRGLIAAERDVLDEWLAEYDARCAAVVAIAQVFQFLQHKHALPAGFPIWNAVNREFPSPADRPVTNGKPRLRPSRREMSTRCCRGLPRRRVDGGGLCGLGRGGCGRGADRVPRSGTAVSATGDGGAQALRGGGRQAATAVPAAPGVSADAATQNAAQIGGKPRFLRRQIVVIETITMQIVLGSHIPRLNEPKGGVRKGKRRRKLDPTHPLLNDCTRRAKFNFNSAFQ
jgi:hypothetical protein